MNLPTLRQVSRQTMRLMRFHQQHIQPDLMTHGVNAALAAYRAMQKSSILMGAMEGGAVNE